MAISKQCTTSSVLSSAFVSAFSTAFAHLPSHEELHRAGNAGDSGRRLDVYLPSWNLLRKPTGK